MSRQAVVEIGSYSVKAGLWEQTFVPTHIFPSFARKSGGTYSFGGSFVVGKDEVVEHPIINGRVTNPKLLQDLLQYVLKNELGLMEPWNDVYLLLILPPACGREVQEECLRISFEQFGLAGAYLAEAPVLASLGCAQANGIVVDIGHSGTEVSLVWDGHLVRSSSDRYPVGGADIERHLLEYLERDNQSASDLPILTKALKENCQADSGYDFLLLDAAKLYFQPHREHFGLQHFIVRLLSTIEADKRPILLDSVVLTGHGSQLKGLKEAFVEAMKACLPVSGFAADHQSNRLTIRHVPEYYPEVWERAGPVAAWFGGGITAKMVFADGKAHYTREEYSQLGARQLLFQKPL